MGPGYGGLIVQFFVFREDKPDAGALRLKTRPAHLEYAASIGDKLIFAGPTMDEDGNMNASVWIIEAANMAEAEAITAADPYEQVDLFETKLIRHFLRTAGTSTVNGPELV